MSDADYTFGVHLDNIELSSEDAKAITSELNDAVYAALGADHDLDGTSVEVSAPEIGGTITASFSTVASPESDDG